MKSSSTQKLLYHFRYNFEIKEYDWDKNEPKHGRGGHFTQMVWKASTDYGVGIHYDSKTKKTYIVARYTPAGNILDQFADNVMPAKTN